MALHTPIAATPARATSFLARMAKDLADAQALADAAAAYAAHIADCIKRTERHSRPVSPCDSYELAVCNAAIDVVDDGDFYARREEIMSDNGWDENGNALPDEDPGADKADHLYELACERRMEAGK